MAVSCGLGLSKRRQRSDMIGKDLEAEILRLYHAEKWRINTIARQLGCHHSTVERVLSTEGVAPRRDEGRRPRKIDPWLPFLKATLEKYPTVTARRLYDMAKERGYDGKSSQFRAVICEIRGRRPAEAFLRLETLPGEQAQVDWAHFGRMQCGRALRPLMGFVIVLSYSRAIYLRFFLSQNLSSFLQGHELAFRWYEGIPRVCLYDNLRSVVLERMGSAIRFNPEFSGFAGHCRFEPRPVAVARGNEKGRVERAIRYIRTNFFAARRYRNLEDLNDQALRWCETSALERCWVEDPRRSVREVFLEERAKLLSLPANTYPCEERKEVSIGKTPYARFDLNDYSTPPHVVERTVTVLASATTVRILDGKNVVAVHERSYDRGQSVTEPEHTDSLRRIKLESGHHGRTSVLSDVAPSSTKLLAQLVNRGPVSLSKVSAELLSLLNTYGAAMLEAAIAEALANDAPHPHAVRHICERVRRESGKTHVLPLALPKDARIENLHVKPRALNDYDHLVEDDKDDEKEGNAH